MWINIYLLTVCVTLFQLMQVFTFLFLYVSTFKLPKFIAILYLWDHKNADHLITVLVSYNSTCVSCWWFERQYLGPTAYIIILFIYLFHGSLFYCWSQLALQMLALSLDICTEVGLPGHTFHTDFVVETVHQTVVASRVSLNASCVDPSWMKPCDPNIIWRLAPPTVD